MIDITALKKINRTSWCEKVIGDNDIILFDLFLISMLIPYGPPIKNFKSLFPIFVKFSISFESSVNLSFYHLSPDKLKSLLV